MSHRIRFYRNVVGIDDTNRPTPKAFKNAERDNKRSTCKGFSDKSKLRLHRTLEGISRTDNPYLITLTYHRLERDWKKSKRHLDRFLKGLRRRDSKISGVWRLEYQIRESIHYHLVVWTTDEPGTSCLDNAGDIAEIWMSASDQTGRHARRYSCDVQYASSPEAAFRYIVGHHLKEDQVRNDLHGGRYWGIFGRTHLGGLEPTRTEEIGPRGARFFYRLLATYKSKTAGGRLRQSTVERIAGGGCKEVFVPYHQQCRLFELAKAEGLDQGDPPF